MCIGIWASSTYQNTCSSCLERLGFQRRVSTFYDGRQCLIATEIVQRHSVQLWYVVKETSRIEILTSLGGWEGLRNFETAAYSQFIHSTVFKEDLLPRHAHTLADRLGGTVKTLIVPVMDNHLDDVHSGL